MVKRNDIETFYHGMNDENPTWNYEGDIEMTIKDFDYKMNMGIYEPEPSLSDIAAHQRRKKIENLTQLTRVLAATISTTKDNLSHMQYMALKEIQEEIDIILKEL